MSEQWEQSTPGVGTFAEIRWFREIDSTNRYLLDQAKQGAAHGLVAVADSQTAGRGRRDRTWIAPPGSSLLCSLLLRPQNIVEPFIANTMVALSARAALVGLTDDRISLKWPNDLMLGGKKFGGILTECLWNGDQLEAMVVGIGINLSWPDVLPEEIAQRATALNHLGFDVGRDKLLELFLQQLDLRLERDDAASVMREFRSVCATLGQKVRIERESDELVGIVTMIDDDGVLHLEQENGEVTLITSGDVVHLR